jgi:hypothetical protein
VPKAIKRVNGDEAPIAQSTAKPMLGLRGKMVDRILYALFGASVGFGIYPAGEWLILGPPSFGGYRQLSGGETAFLFFAFLVAIIAAIGLPTLVLRWQLWFDCPHCGKSLSTGQPWRCGRCGHDHQPIVVCFGTIVSWCQKCRKKPLTLKCPHCRGIIDLVNKPDRRHHATLPAITPIISIAPDIDESDEEIQQKRKRRRDEQADAILSLEHETALREAQVKLAMAEAKLNRFIAQQDEGAAAIKKLMDDIHGADRRNSVLAE